MAVSPIPSGYHTITAQLSVEKAGEAIEFYVKAFGAEVVDVARAPTPGGVDAALDPSGQKVMHGALRIGSSMIFVNDVFPDMGGSASTSSMWLYVPDTDAAFERAVAAGAKPLMPPADMFWGDRMGHVADPFGQKWTIATHVKDMTPAETKAAADAFFASTR